MIETLERNGIDPPKTENLKTTCPECSYKRKKRNEKCLRIWTDDMFVFWACFHCKWESSDVIV